jgi:hypothetical protein
MKGRVDGESRLPMRFRRRSSTVHRSVRERKERPIGRTVVPGHKSNLNALFDEERSRMCSPARYLADAS